MTMYVQLPQLDQNPNWNDRILIWDLLHSEYLDLAEQNMSGIFIEIRYNFVL